MKAVDLPLRKPVGLVVHRIDRHLGIVKQRFQLDFGIFSLEKFDVTFGDSAVVNRCIFRHGSLSPTLS
ncbi:hypothetical protein [Desulfatiglans anilini]|uniref:hypothetical protein n=1 Tax=Desulfatiglans anilini TaxID=90728 RepID=UPI001377291B|nr:hypothetical protein [Desulfatiglans anilini]